MRCPTCKGRAPYNQVLNMVSFWLHNIGMAFMTFTLTFAGVVQTHLQRVQGRLTWTCRSELGLFYWMRLGAGVVVAIGAFLFIYAAFVPRRQEVIRRRGRPAAGGASDDGAGHGRPARQRSTATAVPFYAPVGDECALFETALSPASAAAAEGTDRLRQDALRRPHGGAAAACRCSPSPVTTT